MAAAGGGGAAVAEDVDVNVDAVVVPAVGLLCFMRIFGVACCVAGVAEVEA